MFQKNFFQLILILLILQFSNSSIFANTVTDCEYLAAVAEEKKVENELSKFMGENKDIADNLGARAIQGKAYLPGSDDKDEIIENDD